MKNICELLNIEYPLIQGGMALIANHLLASAVSNAGGLGLIATGADTPEKIKEEIRLCKKLTPKPFGVNIMLMSPYAKEIAQLVIDEGVKVVTTGPQRSFPECLEESGHNRYSGCSQRCSCQKNGAQRCRCHNRRRHRSRRAHRGPYHDGACPPSCG